MKIKKAMKKYTLLILIAFTLTTALYAQSIKVEIPLPGAPKAEPAPKKVKKGGPPPWAPAHGYRAQQRYYFFPDISVYFDITRGGYWFLRNNAWVFGVKLPSIYNPYNEYKIQIDFSGDHPYKNISDHKVKYKNPKKGNNGNKGNAKPVKVTKMAGGKGGDKGNGKGNSKGKH